MVEILTILECSTIGKWNPLLVPMEKNKQISLRPLEEDVE